jgi:DNA polymerase I
MPKAKNSDSKKYMIVDGNAIMHRAYHAIPHLSNKSGEPTNAVYGFALILLGALKDINPTHVAVAFDLGKPTFRHDQYKDYKATRVKTADDLLVQFPRCKEVVRALGIPVFEQEGFEADDVIGTLSSHIQQEEKGNDNYEILIVTGDLDFLQLVNEHVHVYRLQQGITSIAIYDSEAVRKRYGIEPGQILDFKAIKGDSSDNIKGVKGIGEIGALNLIKEFGSIKGIYENLDKLKEKTRKLFEEQRADLGVAYEISKIVCDIPFEKDVPQYHFAQIDYEKMVGLFQELEFKSLIPKLPKVEGAKEVKPEEAHEIAAKENKNYFIIDTIEKLEELSKTLAKQEEFAFDTETEGLGALDFDLVGVAFSFKEGEAYYVPASVLLETKFDGLTKVFEDEKIRKIAHNIKYDYLALKKFGINTKNLYFDTIIASYLLSPGSRAHSLDTLVFNEFGYQMQPIEQLIGKGKNQLNMKDVAVDKISFYCCEDVDYTFRVKQLLSKRLKEENLEKILFGIEMPLTKILADIEENGILLDTSLYADLEKTVEKSLKSLEKEIYSQAGEEFNINSPSQLKVILFDKLNIAGTGGVFIKKTKTGFSTAASELEKMRGMHPIIDLITSYRELSKLQSTYITALPTLVSKRDKRLHSSFNQTIAATGRLSSTNPNLQNIPAGSSGPAYEIRKGFVASPGYKLLSIDYSQIELRVVAHLSEDPTMMRIFKEGRDIHSATAMQVYGVKDPKEVTKEMRRDAKTINFGVLYGVSSFGLSEQSEMNRAQAAEFIKKYFEAFPKVDEFLKNVIKEAKTSGYVENEIGRKRYFPEINSSMFQVRAGAERAAINMPVQSLAADILKLAMIQIDREMDIQSDDIKMLLQVHDELVFEVKENMVEKYAKQIHEIMEKAYKLKVPLIAEGKVGDNWAEMEKIEI